MKTCKMPLKGNDEFTRRLNRLKTVFPCQVSNNLFPINESYCLLRRIDARGTEDSDRHQAKENGAAARDTSESQLPHFDKPFYPWPRFSSDTGLCREKAFPAVLSAPGYIDIPHSVCIALFRSS